MNNTQNLFSKKIEAQYIPLAERARPRDLDGLFGHKKYLAAGSALRIQLEKKKIPSLILWGPPGVGKTTLAGIIASLSGLKYESISAVSSGKKEITEIIQRARQESDHFGKSLLLFIDEIHRFNKVQQDALLHAIESGIVKLIGATTENPSFEVIAPLLSRCQVLKLESLTAEDIKNIIQRAIRSDEILKNHTIEIKDFNTLIRLGGGDARNTLNLLENCFHLTEPGQGKYRITKEIIEKAAEQNVLLYDKKGDYHYDLISAFIKSIRGSDPDAAVYYLARMLQGGEDPLFVARRMIILASEDVGNAEPYALSLAVSAFTAVNAIGMPEARIVLSQVATYLAACPKSNAAYLAIDAAAKDVQNFPTLSVPLAIRNAPTALMNEIGYGKGYKYPHDHPGHFVKTEYLPEKIAGKVYYNPTKMGREKVLRENLKNLWQDKYTSNGE